LQLRCIMYQLAIRLMLCRWRLKHRLFSDLVLYIIICILSVLNHRAFAPSAIYVTFSCAYYYVIGGSSGITKRIGVMIETHSPWVLQKSLSAHGLRFLHSGTSSYRWDTLPHLGICCRKCLKSGSPSPFIPPGPPSFTGDCRDVCSKPSSFRIKTRM